MSLGQRKTLLLCSQSCDAQRVHSRKELAVAAVLGQHGSACEARLSWSQHLGRAWQQSGTARCIAQLRPAQGDCGWRWREDVCGVQKAAGRPSGSTGHRCCQGSPAGGGCTSPHHRQHATVVSIPATTWPTAEHKPDVQLCRVRLLEKQAAHQRAEQRSLYEWKCAASASAQLSGCAAPVQCTVPMASSDDVL